MDNRVTRGGPAVKHSVEQDIPKQSDSCSSLDSQIELEADRITRDVHCSLMRAIDSTNQMPISEHVFYSSFESYDNIMIAQRKTLDEIMSKLSSCSAQIGACGAPGNDFNTIEDLMDKYDTIHEFSEALFDKIGQNLDDAEGSTSRNAKSVQATLEAANRNRMSNYMVAPKNKQIQLKGTSSKPDPEKSQTTSSQMQQDLSVLKKSRSTFNSKQMFAYKELYAWRDSISLQLDKSVEYVLPSNLMIRIAVYLPREPQGITALCNPIPPTVKKYLSDIHSIILKAIDVPDEISKVIAGNYLDIDPAFRSIDLDIISHKQDIAHSAGMQKSVPGLLEKISDETKHLNDSNGKRQSKSEDSNAFSSRLYNFFETSWSKSEKKRRDIDQKQFVSPYSRYEARNN